MSERETAKEEEALDAALDGLATAFTRVEIHGGRDGARAVDDRLGASSLDVELARALADELAAERCGIEAGAGENGTARDDGGEGGDGGKRSDAAAAPTTPVTSSSSAMVDGVRFDLKPKLVVQYKRENVTPATTPEKASSSSSSSDASAAEAALPSVATAAAVSAVFAEKEQVAAAAAATATATAAAATVVTAAGLPSSALDPTPMPTYVQPAPATTTTAAAAAAAAASAVTRNPAPRSNAKADADAGPNAVVSTLITHGDAVIDTDAVTSAPSPPPSYFRAEQCGPHAVHPAPQRKPRSKRWGGKGPLHLGSRVEGLLE